MIDFLSNQGANVAADLEELWRRIVFSILVSNTDDHLRNHGFMLTKLGWKLSPAYDINPNPQGRGLSLNINGDENRLDLDLAREIAEFCRLKPHAAEKIINDVRNAAAQWRKVASKQGISRAEQESMEPAFAALAQAKPTQISGPCVFWLTASGKRHNPTCRFYKTSKGRQGTAKEGVPCSRCGG